MAIHSLHFEAQIHTWSQSNTVLVTFLVLKLSGPSQVKVMHSFCLQQVQEIMCLTSPCFTGKRLLLLYVSAPVEVDT